MEEILETAGIFRAGIDLRSHEIYTSLRPESPPKFFDPSMPDVVERAESLPIPSGSTLINSPPIKPQLREVYNEPVSHLCRLSATDSRWVPETLRRSWR